eukprot:g6037.t1
MVTRPVRPRLLAVIYPFASFLSCPCLCNAAWQTTAKARDLTQRCARTSRKITAASAGALTSGWYNFSFSRGDTDTTQCIIQRIAAGRQHPDAFAFILSYFRDKSKSALLDIIHHYYLAQYASFHETQSSGYGDVYPQNLTFCRACVIPLNYDKEFTNVYMERKGHSGDKYKYSDGKIWGWESDGSTMRPGAVMTFPVLRDFRKTLTTAQKRVASSGVHQLRYLQMKGFEFLNFDKWWFPRKQGQQYPLCPSGDRSRYCEPRDNETRAMMWFTKIR